MLTLLTLLLNPDVVRINVTNTITVDHPFERAGANDYLVQMRCTDGVDNPVVVTNGTNEELLVTSKVGIARLSPAREIGPHSATFRSLPRSVPSLTITNRAASFTFSCLGD